MAHSCICHRHCPHSRTRAASAPAPAPKPQPASGQYKVKWKIAKEIEKFTHTHSALLSTHTHTHWHAHSHRHTPLMKLSVCGCCCFCFLLSCRTPFGSLRFGLVHSWALSWTIVSCLPSAQCPVLVTLKYHISAGHNPLPPPHPCRKRGSNVKEPKKTSKIDEVRDNTYVCFYPSLCMCMCVCNAIKMP